MKRKIIAICCILGVCCLILCLVLIGGCGGCAKNGGTDFQTAQEPTPTAIPKKDPVYYYDFPNVLGAEAGSAVEKIKETGFENIVLKSEDGNTISNYTDYIVKRQNKKEGEKVKSDEEIVLTCSLKRFELYIEIDFHKNWIFDKYDLELYYDGELLDTLPHGEQYTRLIESDIGDHNITIYSADNHDISYSYDLELTESSTFSCNINSHGDSLEVSHIYYAPGVQYARIEMPDLEGKLLPDAIKELESLEFLNINYESDDGWPVIIQGNWKVSDQNIKAGLHIDKNEEIVLTVTRNW